MNIPADKETHEGTFATYWFDNDGILVVRSKGHAPTMAATHHDFELIRGITHSHRVCGLILLSDSEEVEEESGHFAKTQLPEVYKALAITGSPEAGKKIMDFLYGENPPVIPVRYFEDEAEASAWIHHWAKEN